MACFLVGTHYNHAQSVGHDILHSKDPLTPAPEDIRRYDVSRTNAVWQNRILMVISGSAAIFGILSFSFGILAHVYSGVMLGGGVLFFTVSVYRSRALDHLLDLVNPRLQSKDLIKNFEASDWKKLENYFGC